MTLLNGVTSTTLPLPIPPVTITESSSHKSGTGFIPVIGLLLMRTLYPKAIVFEHPRESVIVRDKLYPEGIL
ncbi:MAG: hypothetical protein BWX61_00959 [Bacteroidetes bacterium ADurb.Bin035]|nr:MAG: hypothetical protein BWX61_00959 [Bacteroidetes bacterium ADurb.Bin035]